MRERLYAALIAVGVHGVAFALLLLSLVWQFSIKSPTPMEVQLWDIEEGKLPAVEEIAVNPSIEMPVIEEPVVQEPVAPKPIVEPMAQVVTKTVKPVQPKEVAPTVDKSVDASVPLRNTLPQVERLSAQTKATRLAELQRLLNESQKSTQVASPSLTDKDYIQDVATLVRSQVFFDEKSVSGQNPLVQFELSLSNEGRLLNVRKTRPSSFPTFDDAVEQGLMRISQFPKPDKGSYPTRLVLNYRMNP